MIRAGEVSLNEWRPIWRGGAVTLDPACAEAVARSATAVERIVARGEPVYGVNTGFGKLATVRIEAADLDQPAAQYRAVPFRRRRRAGLDRGDAADDGAEARKPRARRLGVRAGDAGDARSDAAARRDPGRSRARFGRRLGRSRAARAYGGGDDRRRRSLSGRPSAFPPQPALRAPALRLPSSRRRRGWRCSTARSSRPPTLSAASSRSSACFSRRW